MKRLNTLFAILVVGFALFAANTTRAGLQIPYVPDANTVHLWHFDAPSGTTTTDEVVNLSVTLTNATQTNVPGSTITLGSAGAAGLGNCLHIIPTNLFLGNTFAFASGGSFAVSNLINQSSGGAFTFEAVIKFDVNPFAIASGSGQNWEIVCGDSGNSSRAWQFRVSPGPAALINFNAAPGVNAAVNNLNIPLPNSGIDSAVATNQWYHVAVTYTGSAPTNSDPAGVFSVYWTALDANRTNADLLYQTNVQAGFGIPNAATAVLGVGGNGRANNGVANNEGFKGYVDEVRMSVVARKSNEMAFTTGGSLNPAKITSDPPASTFLGFGQTLNLAALATGSLPITYTWQQDPGTGYTNVLGQTNNSLLVSNATFAAAGNYRLIAANGLGAPATSAVANVSIGAAVSELFPSGVAADGTLPTGGSGITDPHYSLIAGADINNLGPAATIWNMITGPVKQNGGRFSNPDGVSQWIGPTPAIGSPSGIYTYRTHFLIDQAQPSTVVINGNLGVNVSNLNMVLNGASLGPVAADKANVGLFTLTSASGLIAGINTLDFVTTNSSTAQDTESALRIEMFGLGQALPAGAPAITLQPQPQTITDGSVDPNAIATFAVVASGRPPLTYQWKADGTAIAGATNRTLVLTAPSTNASPGVNFSVIVSNASGPTPSQAAKLTLLPADQAPVVSNYNLTVYVNQTLNFDLAAAFYAAKSPNNDGLILGPFDGASTNGGSIAFNGNFLSYTPVTDYIGADEFNYSISDLLGTTSTGAVNINVLPISTPTLAAPTGVVSGHVTLTGAGGTPTGGFHVLATADLTLPITSWTAAVTGTFDGTGHFSVNIPVDPTVPYQFFRIQVP